MPEYLNLSKKVGMAPGVLIHVGDILEQETTLSLINYNQDNIEKKQIFNIDELIEYKDKKSITWVNIEGLQNVSLIESIGKTFNIHTLVLEDILNTHQRAKFEAYDDYLYIVLKELSVEKGMFSVLYEQVSIVVFKNFVFTFKEKKDLLFEPIIKRLENNKGRGRTLGTDYLTYALLDTIVDMNFLLLDALDLTSDEIEEELLSHPTPKTLSTIQQVKRELIYVRKSISPLRELLSSILRSDSPLILEETHIYFKDIYDHSIHIIEEIETYRDILTSLLDIYISSVSNKMNEVMKVLTIFATIFIPLTFMVGVYGMNFEYMPELKWQWAYPALWVGFIVFTLTALGYFKKKKWI